MAFELDQLYGAFVPTTRKFSESQVRELRVDSPEFKEFLVDLLQAFNDLSIQLNEKDFGRYPLQEIINGQLFFPDPTINRTAADQQTADFRQDFRTVVNFGTLPNNSTTSQPHGITNMGDIKFTRFYGAATKPGSNFVAVPNSDIKLTADTTNITITTSSVYSGYTSTIIVCEYLRN